MITALIPARKGSKGIPDKNIYPLNGMRLMSWSIMTALSSNVIVRTVVSSDSPEYLSSVFLEDCVDVVLRPPVLAVDSATDYGYINHYLSLFPDTTLVVLLRPTTPLRDPNVVDIAIQKLLDNPEATSLRSAHLLREPPDKMFTISEKYYEPLSGDPDLPRQQYKQVYHPNGYVDVIRPEIVRQGSVYGDRILPYITEEVTEIDRPRDIEVVEWELSKRSVNTNQ